MLEELFDTISKVFCWRWPTSQGEVTAVDVESIVRQGQGEVLRLAVAYKFSLGADGPYTGESFWEPGSARVLTAKESIKIGEAVTVRYRPGKPSVNTLDRRVWREL